MVNIQPFTKQTVSSLLGLSDGPNLSVYMPTHQTFPERNQDPIRLKNLIRKLEGSLELHHPHVSQQTLLAPFHALVDDHDFWNSCAQGIAVFGGLEHFTVVGLNHPVPEVAVVNSHPYVKPLLRLAPMADRYQVLCLSRNKVGLYEGSAQTLRELQLPDAVPSTLEDALGDELTPRNQQGHPDGFSGGGERGDPMMHESGGGGKQDEINLDRERFFRIVDRTVTEHCSGRSGLPLILVALPENQAVFRALSRNPSLLPTGIEKDPATLTPEAMRTRCGEMMRMRHDETLNAALDRYGVAVGQQQCASALSEIAHAATEGRVALLLVEAERWVEGSLDPATGDVVLQAQDQAESEDVLNELILTVIQCGGEVVVVPPERLMPTDTGAAAVYRY